jgi:hypothetical protein
MKFQQQPESTWNPAKVTKPVTQNLPKPVKKLRYSGKI